MPEMIEVQIDSVRVHLMTPQRLVVLKQIGSERYLPIWVGPYEAEAITVALQEVEMIRPLTHDLLKNVFGAFNAQIRRIEIVKLQNEIFYGNIVAEVDGREVNVDSRPSDAIALSVRAHVPILVHRSVMDEAGIIPEQDIPDEDMAETPETSEPVPPLSQEGTERLTIFEDFLDKLQFDKPDDKDKPDDDDDASASDKPKKPKKK
jgi:bifunctional DNase/RNase